MLRKVLILLGFFVFALFASAQVIVRDSAIANHEYHLKLDSVPAPETDKTELLKSREHFAKVDFLNDFQLNTKSREGDKTFKWTLDSIVVSNWNEDSQSVEKSLWQVLISQNNGLKMLVKNYDWNEDKNHWLIGDANYYFFNESGRLDSVEFQEYVTVNYRMFTKTYYSYQDGLLASEWSKEKLTNMMTGPASTAWTMNTMN